jgi:hypothetical protein
MLIFICCVQYSSSTEGNEQHGEVTLGTCHNLDTIDNSPLLLNGSSRYGLRAGNKRVAFIKRFQK